MIGDFILRRSFLTLLGGAAAWPLTARAQQGERVRRIGVLAPYAKDDPEDRARLSAFREGLTRLGWTEGRNIQFEYRWYAGDPGLASTLAKELVALHPDVILVGATPGIVALQQETRTIPLVFVAVADPVDQGVVVSLARPGGNATGFSFVEFSVGTKLLEALKQIAPRVVRVAIVYNERTIPWEHYLRPIETAALSLGLQLIRAPVHDPTGIEAAITAIGRDAGGGLMCLPDSFLNFHRQQIIGLAAHYNLPAIYGFRFFPDGGGLISYGVDVINLYRQSALYVDRVLRGEKPADLPVQQPTKFELVINLKTAEALGLAVPDKLLALADAVIE